MTEYEGPDPAYLAEMAYERYLESRWDEDTMRDLAQHEAEWPNGYGRPRNRTENEAQMRNGWGCDGCGETSEHLPGCDWAPEAK